MSIPRKGSITACTDSCLELVAELLKLQKTSIEGSKTQQTAAIASASQSAESAKEALKKEALGMKIAAFCAIGAGVAGIVGTSVGAAGKLSKTNAMSNLMKKQETLSEIEGNMSKALLAKGGLPGVQANTPAEAAKGIDKTLSRNLRTETFSKGTLTENNPLKNADFSAASPESLKTALKNAAKSSKELSGELEVLRNARFTKFDAISTGGTISGQLASSGGQTAQAFIKADGEAEATARRMQENTASEAQTRQANAWDKRVESILGSLQSVRQLMQAIAVSH